MLLKNSIPAWILTLVICVFLAQSAAGKVIYVDDDANGANNGTSRSDAYSCLRDAR